MDEVDESPAKLSTAKTGSVGLLPPQLPPPNGGLAVGSATGNPRNKVALQKGFSLMDWVRLSKSGRDLTGGLGGPRLPNGGGVREITRGELSRHRKRTDAWMALNGAVYNVTAYMDFHPGGWDELMKGAGKDATKLFNSVHRWVNYETMLSACLIGKLVEGPLLPPLPRSATAPSPPKAVPVMPPIVGTSSDAKPAMDYFQTEDRLTINIFTRRTGGVVGPEDVVVDSDPELNKLRILTRLPGGIIYLVHFVLPGRLASILGVRVTAGGKIEIDLGKKFTNIKKPYFLVSFTRFATRIRQKQNSYFFVLDAYCL
jgi:cytochrome b involved in lipid metabolism